MFKNSFKIVKDFLYPIKYSKLNFTFTLICSFVWWIVSVYLVIFLKNIANAIEIKNWELVKFYSIGWFFIITLRFITRLLYKVFPFGFMRDSHSGIYNRMMTIFFEWNNNEIEKIWTGRIISIIQKWIWSWNELLFLLSWDWANKFFTTLIVFFIIWKSNIYVMFIWLLVLLLCFFWGMIFYPKAVKWRKKTKAIDTEIDRLTILHIMNKFEIFQNNKQNEEINKIYKSNQGWYKYKIREKIWQWFSYDWIEYFVSLILLFVALYFSYLIFKWNANFWDFVLFTWFATLLWNQIKTFTGISKRFSDWYIHIEKMQEIIERIREKDNLGDEKKEIFEYKKWDIKIKNISFSYWSNIIFNNFSLNILYWKKTAFVWESGWWKSTLIKLLAWYMKVDDWDIFIDWQKLSSIRLSDYYNHIWYLTQDPSVFDWTIFENLTYALKTVPSKEEIDKSIRLSKCEFIYELKNWLKTEIWERGIRLSWWQKQRLAIAKIMLKNPDIILLDEPTSALDSFNEEMINIALNNLFKWKTVIIIAHRLQTVKEADNILLFENWEIIEKWTHRELIKLKWKYKKMLDLQSGF